LRAKPVGVCVPLRPGGCCSVCSAVLVGAGLICLQVAQGQSAGDESSSAPSPCRRGAGGSALPEAIPSGTCPPPSGLPVAGSKRRLRGRLHSPRRARCAPRGGIPRQAPLLRGVWRLAAQCAAAASSSVQCFSDWFQCPGCLR
jgi:hypothetical protein